MTLKFENVPAELEQALRKRAAIENQSLDAVAFDAMARGLGLIPHNSAMKRDLSGIAGARTIDDAARAAFAEQRQIDPELWK